MKAKYIFISIAFAAAISLTSCSREEGRPEGEKVHKVFSAQVETPASKTSLGGNDGDASRSILWTSGDKIAVVSAGSTSISEFTYSGSEPSSMADFEGDITESASYNAVYPFSIAAASAANSFTLTLPSTQTYKAGTFDEGLYPMVAKGTAALNFKSLCGILVLKLKGTAAVQSITFTGFDSDSAPIVVAGNGTVDMTYAETPVLTMASDASTSVTLDCSAETGGGVQLSETEPTSFYIVLPVGTYSTFQIKVIPVTGGIMTKTATMPLTIKRNTRTPAAALTYVEDPALDLSATGTANCYIVPTAGNYTLNAKVIGNGPAGLLPSISQDLKKFHATTTDITPLSAKILWQDVDNMIYNLSLDVDGKLLFTASSSKGNALVAVYDNANPEAEGAEILWSWHIWCTDTPADENYKNWVEREFTLMDRNLGATARLGYGLHYQWGRKDPFSRSDSNLTIDATSSEKGTIANTVSHPTYYYLPSSAANFYDWYYDSEQNDYLWGNPEGYNYATNYTAYKSVYDPCPPGYMVAQRDTWTGFTTIGDFNVCGSWSGGWTFYNSAQGSGSTSWYPAAGCREFGRGDLVGSNFYGHYWSSSPCYSGGSYRYGGYLYFDSGDVGPLNNYTRANGFSVRCSRVPSEDFINFIILSPSLGAVTATEITTTTAKICGEVTNLGGATVGRGVVYSTSANPTTSTSTKVTSNTGTNGKGSFSVDLTGLLSGTTYYVRAYAINAAGTSYSEEITFTTRAVNGGNEDFGYDDFEF